MPRRVLMIGLDGFELSVAERLMAEGRLPGFARLQEHAARVLLDHGPAKRSGLAWEHVSSGLSPEDAGRWAAVHFDGESYRARQRPALTTPFPALLDRRCLVFDTPYFDLSKAQNTCGLVSWGAHDPGVPRQARPEELDAEIRSRFGPYPAQPWIYGFTWPSPERAEAMARDLIRAAELRAEVTEWLFGERIPDWDLAIVTVSEFHSAIEALWHGVDPDHPLNHLPSAPLARAGIEGVYEAVDRMVGRLIDRFPDTMVIAFAMHGMGPNNSDVASMALLPELLYRDAFGTPCMGEGAWPLAATGVPLMAGDRGWEEEVNRVLPRRMHYRPPRGRLARLRQLIRGTRHDPLSIAWMPASRYAPFWPDMPAFALPSFYDGRIRINLKGREARGMVEPAGHAAAVDRLCALLDACRDVATGEPVVDSYERNAAPPLEIGESHADLTILWRGAPLGLVHPELGRIGPLPYRRSGGHSGRTGVAWLFGEGVPSGDRGTRSAFDVVPTAIEAIGAAPTAPLSGRSFLRELLPAEPAPTA